MLTSITSYALWVKINWLCALYVIDLQSMILQVVVAKGYKMSEEKVSLQELPMQNAKAYRTRMKRVTSRQMMASGIDTRLKNIIFQLM